MLSCPAPDAGRTMAAHILGDELADIVVHHVMPKLHVNDAQHLAHTCRRMRQLVRRHMPGTVWRALVDNSFHPRHPIYKVTLAVHAI